MDLGTRIDPSRRRSRREPVLLAGSALAVTRSRSVAINDLSAEGARLGGRDLPPPGDDVLMIVGPVDRMATVMWRSGDRCGVRFDDPVGAENIAAMKREAGWASVTGWAQ
jgi:PilZ domain-containing protein